LCLVAADVIFDLGHGVRVVFLHGHGQQLVGIIEPRREFVENDDDLFELGALLPERLRPFRFTPYVGLLELALNFGQAFRLAIVVKDTSSTHSCVQRGRQWSA
jgi:hypothetical protein